MRAGDLFKKKDSQQQTSTSTPAPADEEGRAFPQATIGQRARRRLDLDQVRAATEEQERLAAGVNQAEVGPGRRCPARVQGRGRHAKAEGRRDSSSSSAAAAVPAPGDEEDDDEIEDRDGYYAALDAYRNGGKEGPGVENKMLARFKNQRCAMRSR